MPKFKVKFIRLIEQSGELIVEAESRKDLANHFSWQNLLAFAYLNPKRNIKWKHKNIYVDEVCTYIDEETEETADINITELPEILIDDCKPHTRDF